MFISIRPLLLLLSLLCWVGMLVPPNALANDGVRLSEDKLIFRGLVNKPLQRTFTFMAPDKAMPAVEVVRSDLVDADTKVVLLSTNIKVEPETLQKGSQRFTVSITGANAGHFTGNLELRVKGKTGEEKHTLALDIETLSPNVDTDSNSKTLTLPINQGWRNWPFEDISLGPDSPKLGEVTLTLLQNGEGKATIEKASILTMRGSKGSSLPDRVVTVDTTLPMDIQHHEARPLNIVVRGNNIPADEYNGLLYISVGSQPNAVQVPLRLNVKHGPLLPVILLILGPIIGLLIHSWNTNGLARGTTSTAP